MAKMKRRTIAILVVLVVVMTGALYFGVIPLLPLGSMRVSAWYATPSGANGEYTGSYRIVLVSVSGPQKAAGMTTTDPRNPLVFRLIPGAYNVSATYNETFVSENVTVTWGGRVEVFLNFGGPPPP
jgi:hypothetical protein